MRLLPILALISLTGCASPVLLGEDDATFTARLTEFRGETALPGILRAIGTDRGIDAHGCQISMRGDVPRGTVTVLVAGECRADVTDPMVFEQPH